MANSKTMKSNVIDVIEFISNSQSVVSQLFENSTAAINNNASLIVSEGQQAVFFDEGKVMDILPTGHHVLNIYSLPILSALQSWKYGFNGAFHSDIVFLFTHLFTDQEWSAKYPIKIGGKYETISVKAFGKFSFTIKDTSLFVLNFAKNKKTVHIQNIEEDLVRLFAEKLPDIFDGISISIENMEDRLNEISVAAYNFLKMDFLHFGIEIFDFNIENIVSDEQKKEIESQPTEDIIDLSLSRNVNEEQFLDIQKSKVDEEIVTINSVAPPSHKEEQLSVNNILSIKNPEKYYLVIDDKQAGPFTPEQLKFLAIEGKLTLNTLVWKKGMKEWLPAGEQVGLIFLWTQ